MKPNQLFTSMLALVTVVAASCAAPRMAQQGNADDDVYSTTAKAKIYTPAPVKPSQETPSSEKPYSEEQYEESDYYGTSDPYYDMDYASRINRFYYASPWRTYYDPYFYSGWYPYSGWSVGIGFGPFYNNYWNSPYGGWGYAYSPFWGWNNWGWNNYYYGGYYGGGFLGGGYYGGYYGGGFYTGRTTNVPDYRPRPALGRENGIGSYRNGLARPANSRGAVRSDADGNVISRRSRAEMYDANENRASNGRTSTRRTQETTQPPADNRRPTRTESYTPPARQPESRPSYSPPPSRGSSGSGSSSGSSGGGARSGRAGRG